jgi:hypothetical protein
MVLRMGGSSGADGLMIQGARPETSLLKIWY